MSSRLAVEHRCFQRRHRSRLQLTKYHKDRLLHLIIVPSSSVSDLFQDHERSKTLFLIPNSACCLPRGDLVKIKCFTPVYKSLAPRMDTAGLIPDVEPEQDYLTTLLEEVRILYRGGALIEIMGERSNLQISDDLQTPELVGTRPEPENVVSTAIEPEGHTSATQTSNTITLHELEDTSTSSLTTQITEAVKYELKDHSILVQTNTGTSDVYDISQLGGATSRSIRHSNLLPGGHHRSDPTANKERYSTRELGQPNEGPNFSTLPLARLDSCFSSPGTKPSTSERSYEERGGQSKPGAKVVAALSPLLNPNQADQGQMISITSLVRHDSSFAPPDPRMVERMLRKKLPPIPESQERLPNPQASTHLISSTKVAPELAPNTSLYPTYINSKAHGDSVLWTRRAKNQAPSNPIESNPTRYRPSTKKPSKTPQSISNSQTHNESSVHPLDRARLVNDAPLSSLVRNENSREHLSSSAATSSSSSTTIKSHRSPELVPLNTSRATKKSHTRAPLWSSVSQAGPSSQRHPQHSRSVSNITPQTYSLFPCPQASLRNSIAAPVTSGPRSNALGSFPSNPSTSSTALRFSPSKISQVESRSAPTLRNVQNRAGPSNQTLAAGFMQGVTSMAAMGRSTSVHDNRNVHDRGTEGLNRKHIRSISTGASGSRYGAAGHPGDENLVGSSHNPSPRSRPPSVQLAHDLRSLICAPCPYPQILGGVDSPGDGLSTPLENDVHSTLDRFPAESARGRKIEMLLGTGAAAAFAALHDQEFTPMREPGGRSGNLAGEGKKAVRKGGSGVKKVSRLSLYLEVEPTNVSFN